MITLDNIKSIERLMRGLHPSKVQILAAHAIRGLRKRGEDVEVPEGLRQAYDLIRQAEIMLNMGQSSFAVDMHLRNEQTYAPPLFPGATSTGRMHGGAVHTQTIPKGNTMDQTPAGYPPPKAPRPASATFGASPEERIKQAQEALAQAEQAKAQEDARKAVEARLDYEEYLARTTVELLLAVRRGDFAPSHTFAKFRKELNPLAETYGFKLVLVGDKTRAALTAL